MDVVSSSGLFGPDAHAHPLFALTKDALTLYSKAEGEADVGHEGGGDGLGLAHIMSRNDVDDDDDPTDPEAVPEAPSNPFVSGACCVLA